ncbi:hypothetical protein EJ05DRAFT_537551 [Pseudovirgaria hyperparasitica]|uniref:Pre-mRNA-processing factor 39 n=1 Tax=Pseudovirgaria hyperparasitica TaxID=470096 RepID=A0A6A6W8R1_9PEZI|nr:uncharacterized protein EJ05DRAFT_537551 [Pseudovirgaria hyperparasitica]KAF2759242.1 hypothetical protein EJ05DRAFT_537551 [Pseudovirgaria hyperparasitica]
MDDYERDRAQLNEIVAPVIGEPDDYLIWDGVIKVLMDFDGGLNRNSSDLAISAIRDVYDRLLLKFPLFFGYWKKYADLEFSLSGTEGAELVYERGIGSVGVSTALWAYYCEFKMQTCHEPEIVRELFERGAECCGLDWHSEAFWDKWLEFEDRVDAPAEKYKVLVRVSTLPISHYARYYEQIRIYANTRPVDELVPAAQLASYRDQVSCENSYGRQKSEAEKDREIRALVDAHYIEVCQKTYAEYVKRYNHEERFTTGFFTPGEIEEAQLENWRKYLDFEEQEGKFNRTMFLYERCVSICANYEEFWLRYVRWMSAQPDKQENTRHIFARASTIFLPIALYQIRLLWALFEETSMNRLDVARDILQGIIFATPQNLEALEAWASLEHRQNGLDAALDVYRAQIGNTDTDLHVKGAIIKKAGLMIWKFRSSTEARRLFDENVEHYMSIPAFWKGYLQVEMSQSAKEPHDVAQRQRVRNLHQQIRNNGRLPPHAVRQLSEMYMHFLLDNGAKESVEEYLHVDLLVNGSFPTSAAVQRAQPMIQKPQSKGKAKENKRLGDVEMTG